MIFLRFFSKYSENETEINISSPLGKNSSKYSDINTKFCSIMLKFSILQRKNDKKLEASMIFSDSSNIRLIQYLFMKKIYNIFKKEINTL